MNKQEFSASSWRSNQGYTKMHGQPTIKIPHYLQWLRNLVHQVGDQTKVILRCTVNQPSKPK